MQTISIIEERVEKGFVLDEHGNWITLTEKVQKESEFLAHIEAGEIIVDGEWMKLSELIKNYNATRPKTISDPPPTASDDKHGLAQEIEPANQQLMHSPFGPDEFLPEPEETKFLEEIPNDSPNETKTAEEHYEPLTEYAPETAEIHYASEISELPYPPETVAINCAPETAEMEYPPETVAIDYAPETTEIEYPPETTLITFENPPQEQPEIENSVDKPRGEHLFAPNESEIMNETICFSMSMLENSEKQSPGQLNQKQEKEEDPDSDEWELAQGKRKALIISILIGSSAIIIAGTLAVLFLL